MQKLMQTRLFRLLSEASQNEVSISQLEKSCDEFAMEILMRFQSATSHAELYFSFGFIHAKLAGGCEQLSGEQGGKCPENVLHWKELTLKDSFYE